MGLRIKCDNNLIRLELLLVGLIVMRGKTNVAFAFGFMVSAGFPGPPTRPEPGAKRREKGLEAHEARRTPERKRRHDGLRSHEERQGGAIVPEGAEAAGSLSPEGDKGVALGFGLQEAFGSRRGGVKRPQGRFTESKAQTSASAGWATYGARPEGACGVSQIK